MEDLKEGIRQWFLLDRQIDEMNSKLTDMREKRNILETHVINLMKSNDVRDKKLNIGPVSIVYSNTMQLPPYNLELIEQSLDNIYSKGNEQSIQILASIKNTRENKRKPRECIKKRKNKLTQKKQV